MVKVVKGQDVNVKGQALQEEHGSQHAGALDLWQGLRGHVPLKVLLRVQPVAPAVARAPRSPGPLRCLHPAKHIAKSEAVWRECDSWGFMTEAKLQRLLLTVISSQGRRCGLGIGRLVAPPAGVHHDKDMYSRRRL